MYDQKHCLVIWIESIFCAAFQKAWSGFRKGYTRHKTGCNYLNSTILDLRVSWWWFEFLRRGVSCAPPQDLEKKRCAFHNSGPFPGRTFFLLLFLSFEHEVISENLSSNWILGLIKVWLIRIIILIIAIHENVNYIQRRAMRYTFWISICKLISASFK